MPEVGNKQSLTAKQLSELLGFSLDWIYNRTKSGAPDALPCHRIGRSIRFDPDEG